MTDERMSDDDTDAKADAAAAAVAGASPVATEAPLRRRRRVWVLLAALLGVVALAALVYAAVQRGRDLLAERDARIAALAEGLNAAEAQIDRLQTRLSDQAVGIQRTAAEMARFAERLAAQDQAIGLLRDELGGGRARVQLAVVEQLLMLANDRLQVGREVAAALAALEAADARLAALKDPRLYPVREAIARERSALQAVDLPDEVGIALTLSGLIERAPRLPLATEAPVRFEPQPSAATSLPETASAATRAWAAVQRALSSLFSVRRAQGLPPRLVSEEQAALIRQILQTQLEGARLALLRRHTAVFRELCGSAARSLEAYFHAGDPAVASARAELLRLQGIQLEPPLPDISRSLVLLRSQLEAEATH